jgi:hypothetical protein
MELKVVTPKGMLSRVRQVIYADLKMETVFDEMVCPINERENDEEFLFKSTNPCLFYNYSIEWDFS